MTITVDLREMGRRLSGIARLKHSSLPAHPDVKNVGIFYLVLKEGDLKLEENLKILAISLTFALALTVTPWLGSPAYGGEDGSEELPYLQYQLPAVTVEGERPDWEKKLSPGSVTVIKPDKYQGEEKTLPELLQEVPGVHVRYINGKGQYTTVSVRGSTASQVGVFVDGVLANLGGDAAVDISTIPVKNVERIEVYRGYIPARFGGTYMGGVINIVTKKPEKANFSVSYGQRSWGGYSGSLEMISPLGKGSFLLGINRDQSRGDFRYENISVDPMRARNQAGYEQYVSELGDYWSYMGYPSKEDWLASDEYKYYEAEERYSDLNYPFYDATRYRHNNSYQNTDMLFKWQDEKWTVKGTWKNIDRMLPRGLDQTNKGEPSIWQDLDFWTDPRPENQQYRDQTLALLNARKRQQVTETNFLVGRRDTVGNLDWGWRLDYQIQDKTYHDYDTTRIIKEMGGSPFTRPLADWSRYTSHRLGSALDGTYKAGENHLLEFMTNYSQETLNIDGNGMNDPGLVSYDRWKHKYEQTLFNLQVQDTITLNKAEDFWLTPSLRYNFSRVKGIGRNPVHSWDKAVEIQNNSRVTWQVALKKQLNDQWTLRSTYGTYYRLLNLYEIAGDGAGILPRPDSEIKGCRYPLPEEGTQWDFSAIWQGKLLGAKSDFTLTYFGRDSRNLLQFWRFGYDYWSYTNAAKGKVNGVELAGNLNWKKWDLNLAATYQHTQAQNTYQDVPGIRTGWKDIPQPYTPHLEGSARLTYRPDSLTSIFSEVKHTGEMYCYNEEWRARQTSLTTVDVGVKRKLNKDLQLTLGVNDLFDQGPKVENRTRFVDNYGRFISSTVNPTYPIQGRTYYATLQYNF